MDETRDLINRMARLERTNARLRLLLSLAMLLAGVVILMGNRSTEPPAVLEAQKFVLKDGAGHERGALFTTDVSWGLILYNSDSSKGAAFVVSDSGNAAMLLNKKGESGLTAMATEQANTLAIDDLGTNSTAVELKSVARASVLRFLNTKGIDKVDITVPRTGGAAMLLNDDGSRTRTILSEDYPGLATFNAKGDFVWAAGFDGFSKEEQNAMRTIMQKSASQR